ncbi:MAG: hypothetical protein MUQ25_19645 [Candidatus Aminicenantes bacterium]|nr:hypothetical protein [Candidatus Aminicenantes bacterium]
MKRALVAGLLFLFFSPAFGQDWVKGSLEDAQSQAKTQNKPLLAYFHQESG